MQHYHVRAMGEVAQSARITVSAGKQTYTLAAVADLILAGVRVEQADIVKMGGITGRLRCAALAQAHGVELVSHQTQPRSATWRTSMWSPRSCWRPSPASGTTFPAYAHRLREPAKAGG